MAGFFGRAKSLKTSPKSELGFFGLVVRDVEFTKVDIDVSSHRGIFHLFGEPFKQFDGITDPSVLVVQQGLIHQPSQLGFLSFLFFSSAS